MEYVTGVVQNVHSWASKINPSTLSGKPLACNHILTYVGIVLSISNLI